MENYYHLLNIERDAALDEIKSSFRRLALQYHPDKNPGDYKAEEKFKDIQKAYEILSDPEKRRLYDLSLLNNFSGDYINSFSWMNDIPGFGRGCGRKMGFGKRCRRNPAFMNYSDADIATYVLNITQEEALKGPSISLKINNDNNAKTIQIKLPAGIENGAVLRYMDYNRMDDFFIKIRYSDKFEKNQ